MPNTKFNMRYYPIRGTNITKELEKLEAEGWEVVSVAVDNITNPGGDFVVFLRRERSA